jgi:hypothetical protein
MADSEFEPGLNRSVLGSGSQAEPNFGLVQHLAENSNELN